MNLQNNNLRTNLRKWNSIHKHILEKEKRAAWGNTFFHPFIRAYVFITETSKEYGLCVECKVLHHFTSISEENRLGL